MTREGFEYNCDRMSLETRTDRGWIYREGETMIEEMLTNCAWMADYSDRSRKDPMKILLNIQDSIELGDRILRNIRDLEYLKDGILFSFMDCNFIAVKINGDYSISNKKNDAAL